MTYYRRPQHLPPDYDEAADLAAAEQSEDLEHIVIIGYSPAADVWRAFLTDQRKLLDELTGTREQAIAWARQRAADIRICSDPHDETAPTVQLGPDDQ